MDAADKVDNGESKPSARRGHKPQDKSTPQAEAQAMRAKIEQERKKRNPVIETYWELVAGHKLVLCKKTKVGSIHKVFVGSTTDKDNGPAIKAQVKKLETEGKIKVRV